MTTGKKSGAAAAEAGCPAPDFELESSVGGRTSLSSLRGQWVVLYFYPRDNTPGCTREACDLRDNNTALRNAGAVVIGISPDSIKSHGSFIEGQQLPFTLLSDPQREVIKLYAAWKEKTMYGRKTMGVERSTFLIDPQGIIRHAWRKVKVDGHVQEILAVLTKLQSQ